jgi:hypothetical protein
MFNSSWVPNWSGHFLLTSCLTFIEASISEKLVLSLYILGLPLSVRYLFKSLKFKNMYAVYFVFPVTYSFLFYFGFHNFNLGLVFYFLALTVWLKSKQQGFESKSAVIFVLLTLAIYFSHFFVLTMLYLTLAIVERNEVFSLFRRSISRPDKGNHIKKFALLLLPSLVLTLVYFDKGRLSDGTFVYLPYYEILELLVGTPAKAVDYGREGVFTKWIAILFGLNFVYMLYVFFKNKNYKTGLNHWVLMLLTCLVFLFLLPDSNGSAGFISTRFTLFIYFFSMLVIGFVKLPNALNFLNLFITVYVSVSLLIVYVDNAVETDPVALEVEEASLEIYANSIVYTINDSQDRRFAHLSNYLGVNKPMVILENYEAYLNYFPLKWNRANSPEVLWKKNEKAHPFGHAKNGTRKVDYVFVLKNFSNPSKQGEKTKAFLENKGSNFEEVTPKGAKYIKLFARVN